MFYCGNCPTLVGPGQPENRIVTERRNRTYEKLVGRFPNQYVEHVHGWEIATEIKVCPKCFTQLTGKEARVVEAKPTRQFVPRFNDDGHRKKYHKWKDIKRKRQDQDNRPARPPPPEKNRKQPQIEVVNPIKIVR